MDSVLQLSPRERAEVFQRTTQQTGFDAVIVEKDFWVCWTLKELFRLPRLASISSSRAAHRLLQRVVEHKSLFFKSGWAKYAEAIKGQLRLAPPEFRIKALREDYAKMRQMFFEEPPVFELMIEKLKNWEMEFNNAER